MSQQGFQRTPVSNDARAMMMFEANKKSIVVSYLLWFFFGGLGAHRFYNGKIGTGVTQLLLTVFGVLLSVLVVGVLLLIPVGIWWLIDAFLIPGWIRSQNAQLAMQLAG